MSEQTIVIEGRVEQFVKAQSGNIAFMLNDTQRNLRYCFTTGRKPLLNVLDEVIVIGSVISGNKVRANYIINKTKNTEDNLLEKKGNWPYYVSLAFALIVTGGFVVALLFVLGVFPMPSGSIWDPFNFIFGFIYSIILMVIFVPLMIILWVLTAVFSKKKSSESNLEIEVARIKQSVYTQKPSPSKPVQTMDSESLTPKSVIVEETSYRPSFCSHCGEKLPPDAKFCPKCGSKW